MISIEQCLEWLEDNRYDSESIAVLADKLADAGDAGLIRQVLLRALGLTWDKASVLNKYLVDAVKEVHCVLGRNAMLTTIRRWLHLFSCHWITVKDTGKTVYQQCSICGTRQAWQRWPGIGAQPIDRRWVETGLWSNMPPRIGSLVCQDVRYCQHCEEDTTHNCCDSNHERDSSGNWRKCLKCGWEYSGMTGRYHLPSEESTRD